MRWTLARSRSLALMALALGMMPWTTRPPALGQEARPPAASDAEAEREKRVEELDKTIRQDLEAGRIAAAIPPAREKLDLLVRLRGPDHWQTGDARRNLETYERLAARPREVRDRFVEARRGAPGRKRSTARPSMHEPASCFRNPSPFTGESWVRTTLTPSPSTWTRRLASRPWGSTPRPR